MISKFKQINFRDLKEKNEADLNGATIVGFDIDWASDFIIEDSLRLANEVGIIPTLFLTHNSPLLQKLKKKKKYEFGLHPNFEKLLSGDCSNGNDSVDVLGRLTDVFPDLELIRSHSLTTSSRLKSLFLQSGFCMESSFITHGIEDHFPKVWREWTGLFHVPITWEDDVWFVNNENYTDPYTSKILKVDTLNVLTFHPIHLYLNTNDSLHYSEAKVHQKNPEKLSKFRHYDNIGVRSIFKEIGAAINA